MRHLLGLAELAATQLQDKHGFTLTDDGDTIPAYGFFVADRSREKVSTSINTRGLLAYFAGHPLAPGEYWGGWIDAADGRIYLDIVQHYNSKRQAEQASRRERQLSYWDCANRQAIPTPNLPDQPTGHSSDGSGLQNHSIGDIYPWSIVIVGKSCVARNLVTGENRIPFPFRSYDKQSFYAAHDASEASIGGAS